MNAALSEWGAFAALTGGAGAGLASLIFLVVAFRFDTIAVSTEYRSRAAQALAVFLTVLVIAVLLTVPQRTLALGIEMILVALISAAILRSLNSAARTEQATNPNASLTLTLMLFVLGIAASGLLVLLDEGWGLYFYLGSALIGLGSGVYGAWTFLTQAGMTEIRAAETAKRSPRV